MNAHPKRRGKPTKFTGDWATLREACGGTDKLAEALGVHPVVVQKWALHGQKPRAAARKLIALLSERMGVRNPIVDTFPPPALSVPVDVDTDGVDDVWIAGAVIRHDDESAR